MVGMAFFFIAFVALAADPKAPVVSDFLDKNTALFGIILMLFGWIKMDNRAIWDFIDNHGHDIKFEKKGCDKECLVVTAGVIVKRMIAVLIIPVLLTAVPACAADFGPVWEQTILPHEGGYSNNIHDPGNWTGGKEGKGRFLGTKYGIAASVYGTSLLKQGIIIKHLTKDQARALYERDYWRANHLDQLASQGIATELCDEVINMGRHGGEVLLARVFAEIEWATKAPVTVPPKFTPETIRWINVYTRDRHNRVAFYNSIRIKRVKYYVNLVHKKPVMKQFFLSWAERCVD